MVLVLDVLCVGDETMHVTTDLLEVEPQRATDRGEDGPELDKRVLDFGSPAHTG